MDYSFLFIGRYVDDKSNKVWGVVGPVKNLEILQKFNSSSYYWSVLSVLSETKPLYLLTFWGKYGGKNLQFKLFPNSNYHDISNLIEQKRNKGYVGKLIEDFKDWSEFTDLIENEIIISSMKL